jgi:hypothetical protein
VSASTSVNGVIAPGVCFQLPASGKDNALGHDYTGFYLVSCGSGGFGLGMNAKSTSGLTFNPPASFIMRSNEMFVSPRSTRPMKFRWTAHIAASASWEMRRSIRNSFTFLPNNSKALGTQSMVFRRSHFLLPRIRVHHIRCYNRYPIVADSVG